MFFEEYDSQKEMQNQMENMKKVPESTEKENSGQVVGKKDTLKGTENQEKYNEAIENILGKKAGYETVFTYAGNGLTDKIDIGNGEVIEKKVRGFEKEFKGDNEGKSVSVRESENGDIVFTFLNSVNGVNQSTTITLSNMMNIAKENNQSDGNDETPSLLNPTIRIDGSTENLPKFLNDVLTNSQGESIINGEIKLSNDNADNFMKIFEALHGKIIEPKIEEIHGYVQKILDHYEIMDNWLNPALHSVENSEEPPTQMDIFIDGLIGTGLINSESEINGNLKLGINKALASLSVLLSCGRSVQEIKNQILSKLGYSNDELIKQKNVTDFSNEVGIEGIPVVNEDVWFCINNGDILIDLAKHQLNSDEAQGVFVDRDRLDRILTFLNK